MGLLEKIRRWIDGEEAEMALEKAIQEAEKNPSSPSEEFMVKIARAVEEVMRREMIRLPQDSILLPSEYVIFISEEDDKEWRGVKRRALEESLYYILGQRAKELAGKRKLETKRLVMEIRVDGTLEKGEIQVQHTWEDGSSGKTSVFSRQRGMQIVAEPSMKNKGFSENAQANVSKYQLPTVAMGYEEQEKVTSTEGEEETRIAKKITEFYRLEIWRNDVRQNVIPIYRPEIVIGRGSRSKPVDIALQGDPEISRHHLRIFYEAGRIFLVCEGKNPTFIENREIPNGQRVLITPGAMIKVCSYSLRIQPAVSSMVTRKQ